MNSVSTATKGAPVRRSQKAWSSALSTIGVMG
jgi:hypothetical protein